MPPGCSAIICFLNAWVAAWNSYDLNEVDNLFLADKFVQCTRAHARRQRGFCFHAILHGMGE
jgi:hypothetical protein